MKEFREKLEKKVRFYSLFACSSALIFFGCKFLLDGASDFAEGLITGFFSGLMVVMIYYLSHMFAALKNEEKLKEMYIAETDERNIAIGKETASTATVISMMCTALAAIVLGFINVTVCITLAAALFFSAIVTVSVRAYYNKKM